MNRQSTAPALLGTNHPRSNEATAHEVETFEDRELEDLIFSWRRVADPKLRRIALNLVRSMAS